LIHVLARCSCPRRLRGDGISYEPMTRVIHI
jgi:hypothetical protein